MQETGVSGCAVLLDSKEVKLGSSNQEASLSAGENRGRNSSWSTDMDFNFCPSRILCYYRNDIFFSSTTRKEIVRDALKH